MAAMMLEALTPDADPARGSLAGRVKAEAHRLGFELAGVTDVRGSEHAGHLFA